MNTFEKLKQLEQANGPAIQSEDITVGDVKHTFYFKRIPFAEANRIDSIPFRFVPGQKDLAFDMARIGERNAMLISQSLVDENGALQLSFEQASNLHPEVGTKLLEAVRRINKLDKKAVEEAEKNS